MKKLVTTLLFIASLISLSFAADGFSKIYLKDLKQKINTVSGDQKLAYEFVYLLNIHEDFPKKVPGQLAALKRKQDKKYGTLLELYELSVIEDLNQRASALKKFNEEKSSNNLFSTLSSWRYGLCLYSMDSPEALKYFENHLSRYKKYPAIPLSKIYSNIGLLHYYTGNISLCTKNFEKALKYCDKRDTVNQAGYLMNLGVIYFRNGQNKNAIQSYLKADKINGNRDLGIKGMINENLALSYSQEGDSKKTIEYYDKAANSYLLAKDTTKYNALILNKCGEMVENKEFERAIKTLNKTLTFFKESKNQAALASGYLYLSDIYAQMHDTASALHAVNTSIKYSKNVSNFTYFQAALEKASYLKPKEALIYLKELEKYLKEKNFTGKNTSLYNSMGIRYFKMKDYPNAIKYFKLAIDAELKNDPPNAQNLVGYHQNLGVIYYEYKDYNKALAMYKSAEKYLDLEREEPALKADRMLLYANVYGKLKQYKEAYTKLSAHKVLKDSLDNLTVNDKLLSLKQSFQTQQIADSLNLNKKQLALSNLKVQAEKATNQRNMIVIFSLIGVMVLISGLVFMIARINKQRKKTNELLVAKNEEIHQQQLILQLKNDEIIDSINYAKRLQNTILPPPAKMSELFPEHFLIYKPKDIVAGDFYVCESLEIGGRKIGFIAVADCTGHGVPGALVSMVCSAAIKRSVVEFEITEPGKILDKTTELVIQSFQTTNEKLKDGMDISLGCIDFENKKLLWSGANNPLWLIRNQELIEIKGDKQPVGLHENAQPFTTHAVSIEDGDRLYFVSDGYADQFGGPNGKKLKSKNLKDTLLATQELSIQEQGIYLESFFAEWKKGFEQVDDVCIMGVKL